MINIQYPLNVLEIGCGDYPWFGYDFLLLNKHVNRIKKAEYKKNLTEYESDQSKHQIKESIREIKSIKKLMQEWDNAGYNLANLNKRISRYVCVDYDFRLCNGVGFKDPKELKNKIKRLEDLGRFKGRLDILKSNGSALPFPNETFNIVALADMLSVPFYNECHCDTGTCEMGSSRECVSNADCDCAFYSLGISDEEKVQIVTEAIRVLRKDGLLIIGDTSTTFNGSAGYNELRKLHKKGALQLKFFDSWRHRAVFEKSTVQEVNQQFVSQWRPEITTSRWADGW
ncbi:MAG: hypothetical protein Q7K16_04470 [Candidatus Azambacteria bacterium]|nr:hypothetical protein [Candidatus Azambacteria bacterium]